MAKKATELRSDVQDRANSGRRVTRRYIGSAAADAVVLSLIRARSANGGTYIRETMRKGGAQKHVR